MQITQDEIDAMLTGENEAAAAVVAAPVRPSFPVQDLPDEIQRICKLSVPVSVKVAEREMAVRAILSLTVGSIIEFGVPSDSELELLVANHAVGTGRAVKVRENFGLCISRLGSIRQRIEAMGGRGG